MPVPLSSSWKELASPLPTYPPTLPCGGTLPAAGPLAERIARRRPRPEGRVLEAGVELAGRRRVLTEDVVGAEGRAVEVADEVLHARAAGDPAGIEADEQHPLRLAVDLEREQVRAFPRSADGVGRAEVAHVRPSLEVRRAVELHLVLQRLDDGHHPLALRRVPEHLRVAELARADVEHRIARVLRPRASAVGAVGQRLRLRPRPRAGVDRNHRRVAPAPEAARVPPVDDGAAREDRLVALLRDGDGQVRPVHEVAADGMSPGHVPPRASERVVLVEEVVLAAVVDQPVRIVHPVGGRREVELRPVGLPVRRAVLRGRRSSEADHERHGQRDAAQAPPTVHDRPSRLCSAPGT